MTIAQEVLGGEHESTLLVAVDGVGARAEIVATSIADFDECDFVSIEHHQVDLAGSRPIVPRQRTKAATLQKALDRAFGACAEFG